MASKLDPDSLRRRIAEHSRWYHRITLAPGVVTPGVQDSAGVLAHLDQLGLPADCSGLSVLDIGVRDGFFAFELERRGAEVTAIDIMPPTETGFAIAAEILGSGVKYVVGNVYDLAPERLGTFDLVLFLGVLYHLRSPLRALDRIRPMCRPAARLFVETVLIDNRVVLADGRSASLAELAEVLTTVPLMQFYPRDTLAGDHSNKWAPNRVGLARMLEEAEFEVLETRIFHNRGYAVARPISDGRLAHYRALDESGTH
jgi:tRNA (mo5U34)-methyltransferase